MAVALCQLPRAQTPVGTAFTHQGRLTQAGSPANGEFDFEFRLFDAATGGNQQGAVVVLDDLTVSGGLFAAELDFGAGVFGGEERWLEIRVRPGPETGDFAPLQPRQRLTPTPYALHAASAETAEEAADAGQLDGMDSAAFATASHEHDAANLSSGVLDDARLSVSIARIDDIMSTVLASDGAASGLDADTLDGTDSADFSTAAHDHDASYFTETELVTSGGGGQVHFDNLVGTPPMTGDSHSLDASDGDPVDAVFVDVEGNTGIGTTEPTAGLHAAKAGPGFVDPEPLAKVFHNDGTFSSLRGASSVFVSGTTAFVASNSADSFTIIDVSDPTNPALLAAVFDGDGTFSRLDNARSVFVSGTTAYVASLDDDSLTIIDVSDPMDPALLAEVYDGDGTFNRLGGAFSVYVLGTTAYVASRLDHSLTIIDGSDPMNPALLAEVFSGDGTFSRLLGASSVFVSGTTAYVTSIHLSALTIIDVSDPTNPALLAEVYDGDGTFSRLNNARSVFVSGTTAYVTADEGLTIIDVSDPTNPALLAEVFDDGTFSLFTSANWVFVSGTTAYVASVFLGSLTIIDVEARPRYLEVGGDALISGGTGSVSLTLKADNDDSGEGDQPRLTMLQDGGLTRADAGFSNATDNFEVRTRGIAASDILLNPRNNVGIHTTDPTHPLEVGTDASNGNAAHVTAGGVWTNGSDRNSKQDFEQVDRREILERVAELPVTQWRYKGEPESVRHIGPMAQDFMTAFGLGASDRHIGTVDAEGVALVAIQGLYQLVQEKDAQIEALKARLAAVEEALDQGACPPLVSPPRPDLSEGVAGP